MKWWIGLPLSLLLIYLLFLGYLYLFQRTILFHPTHERQSEKGFYLEFPDGKIWIEVRNPGRENALIYFPGNSEHWWEDPDDLGRLLPDHTIYFPHYPGYGASEGIPSQDAFYSMADALYDRITPEHRAVDLVGRSLGSGIALRLAAYRPIRRLVLITPYDSIASLGAERYPFFPIHGIVKDPFESTRYASEVTAPTLIILAEDDRVIPHIHSRNLIRFFQKTEPKVIILPGTDHGNIIDSPEYPKLLRDFLEKK